MKNVEEATRLIIAEKLKYFNERLGDVERDLQFFFEESKGDEECLKIITNLQHNIKQLKEIKNRKNHETVI